MLAFHGAPACRLLFSPADVAAARFGLRVIAPDRPGYGLSDPLPGRTLDDWVDDTTQLMDRLSIARAPIIAVSGGGPYAVASAARLGPRITGLALVSPLGEVSSKPARRRMTRLQRAFFRRLSRHPLLLRQTTAAARSTFLAAPDASYATVKAMLSDVDRHTLSNPLVRTVILDVTREALRPGIEGAVSDMQIYGRSWGVSFSSVRCPSVLWQGNADFIVPARLAFALGASLPGCSVRRLDGQGHFWVLEHVQDVLEAVSAFPS